MKTRKILSLLTSVILSTSLLGSVPVQAATSCSAGTTTCNTQCSGKVNTVLVASKENCPSKTSCDALCKKYNAPMLLVSKNDCKNAMQYINSKLTAKGKVILLGNTGAMPANFEKQLKAKCCNVVKLNPTTPAQKPADKPAQTPASKPAETPTSNTSSSFSAFQNEVLRLVNVERTKAHLKPLTLNTKLSEIATLKSQDMINKNYFDHTSPTYGSPFDMMKKYGINYTAAGENIAMGQATPAEVMTGWMNSPGHRQNILNPNFEQLGVGVAKNSSGRLYWTQMFIK